MEKSVHPTKWTFNRNQPTNKQQFHVGVSFQFVSLDKSNGKKESPYVDMFYPFIGARSGAFSVLQSGLALTLSLTALLLSQ